MPIFSTLYEQLSYRTILGGCLHQDVKDQDERESEQKPTQEIDSHEAEKLMEKFAAITGTDEIFAQTVLQDVNWNLEAALDVFYGSEGFAEIRSAVVVGQSDSSNKFLFLRFLLGLDVSLMSWNIDGLDGRSLATRIKAVHKIITNPDFVFLQEVVEREIKTIERLEVQYNILYSNRSSPYYTAILVSKNFVTEKHDVVHYQNSGMHRTLQIVELAFCFDKVRDIIRANPNSLVFFGGDLNVRDDEMVDLPQGMRDAWIAAGSDIKTKFTWDMRLNNNKEMHANARMRFDRIFWYGPLKSVNISLEGRQRIRSCLCFPSDHWAVHAVFS
ncbi:unnamed protein product [Caenorhabditis auriculariae]|uniref:5'-tyrosyl-DNA phosphodiesterase n=1 Tax=Caenorhabditis auriculariae TaxID=2777116 RepID=A0A8S1GMM4_9PELO|nr:unnamed protein product [Caenorhabditis auriculariae]